MNRNILRDNGARLIGICAISMINDCRDIVVRGKYMTSMMMSRLYKKA